MKQRTKHLFTSVFLLCMVTFLHGQSNTVAAGGDGNGSGGSTSYTIGQTDYIYNTGSDGSVNQGVQQPFEIFILGSDDFDNIDLTALVFPNPTVRSITLKISNQSIESLSYRLYDLSGSLLLSKKIQGEETIIAMDQFAAATYFLSVQDQQSILKTFKIIKN